MNMLKSCLLITISIMILSACMDKDKLINKVIESGLDVTEINTDFVDALERDFKKNEEKKIANAEKLDYCYEKLNKKIFNKLNYNSIENLTYEIVYSFSNEVNNDFQLINYDTNTFSNGLLIKVQEFLYNIDNYELYNNIYEEDILNKAFLKFSENVGIQNYDVNYEDFEVLFPNFKDMYPIEYSKFFKQSYSSNNNFLGVFNYIDNEDKEFFVFLNENGGNNGGVIVYIYKVVDDGLNLTSSFQIQNYGDAKIIEYEKNFYLMFLHQNYSTKVYDGIMLHHLGDNPTEENILIKYIPKLYKWENLYENSNYYLESIDDYIYSITEEITEEYIDNGRILGKTQNVSIPSVYYGDEQSVYLKLSEISDNNFKDDEYCYIDFTNSGIPIYMYKSTYETSSGYSKWHLNSRFFMYDKETEFLKEFSELRLSNELVQLWFKEIDDKVFSFSIYHLDNYNYCMEIVLIEEDMVTTIRTDIFSPQKHFEIIEGVYQPFIG